MGRPDRSLSWLAAVLAAAVAPAAPAQTVGAHADPHLPCDQLRAEWRAARSDPARLRVTRARLISLASACPSLAREAAAYAAPVKASAEEIARQRARATAQRTARQAQVLQGDIKGLHVIRRFTAPRHSVEAIQFLPDGKRFLTAGDDGRIGLWSLAANYPIGAHPTALKFVAHVAVSRSGKIFAAGGDGPSAEIWNADSWSKTSELKTAYEAYAVAISPDETLVVTGDRSGAIDVWNAATGAKTRSIKADWAVITCLTLSPNGKLLALGTGTANADIWDFSSGKRSFKLPTSSATIRSVIFSADDKSVFTAGEDGNIQMWDVASGKLVREFPGAPGPGIRLGLASDGTAGAALIAIQGGHTLDVWRVDTGRLLTRATGFDGYVTAFAIAPDNDSILVSDWSGPIYQLDTSPFVGLY